jgi:hypothetical protein
MGEVAEDHNQQRQRRQHQEHVRDQRQPVVGHTAKEARRHSDHGVMQAARLRGVRIPEELSVIGFDDTFEASIVTPPLTTVRQPLAEMGRMAVNLLVRQLQNQRIEALHVQLETKLVVRDSTAPPPSGS